ncbi:hypothetical protein [Arthrobacter sp. RCC_34]|uniref:variant leucine-rich repeat-containing protein n=1 Tax=Arthrobacter sp. RCC_34 TaxID=3239230 RepID=UPI0035260295
MTGTYQDGDWIAAQDPGAPPGLLSEIAFRRWDLHPVLEANPALRPELRQWIAQVNPPHLRQYPVAGAQPVGYGGQQPGFPQPVPPLQQAPGYGPGGPAGAYPQAGDAAGAYGPGMAGPAVPRRSGPGPWIAGCGCLALVFVLVLVGFGLGGLNAIFSSGDRQGPPGVAQKPLINGPSASSGAQEQLRAFEAEMAKFDQLAATLKNNPVAPIVADARSLRSLETRAKTPGLSVRSATNLTAEARQLRQKLEQRIAAAKVRRVNASGSLSEGLVDSAGNGFIDIRWDAATACGKAKSKTGQTVGCVKGSDPLTVHLLKESAFSEDWDLRMVVVHELAHVYQRADEWSSPGGESRADRLVARGLFQKSNEKMADCYALTYYNEWSLERNGYRVGYGYVCNASERQAIRSWAAAIKAPMPK